MKIKQVVASCFVASVAAFAMIACSGQQGGPGYPEDNKPDSEIDTTNQIVMQYCSEDIIGTAGQEESQKIFEQSAAIKLTAEQLNVLASNRMFKIMVGIGDDSKAPAEMRDNLKVWLRRDLYSSNIWEQKFEGDIQLSAWHEVVMSPYFKIDGEDTRDLYVGYTIEACGLPIAGDGSKTPNKNATWLYDCGSEKWIHYDNIGNLCIKAVFAGENMPEHDVTLSAIEAPSYIKANAPFSVVGAIKNNLTKEIKSFDLVVRCGKEEVVKQVELPWSLVNGETQYFFAHDIKLTKEGESVEYSIENLNGGEEDDNKKDNTITVNSVVASNLVDRIVLLENTTGDACSNCPAGHKYIEDNMKALGEENFVWAAHHAGYNAGKFTSNQSDTIARVFYGPVPGGMGMTYAPGLMIDRTNLLNVGVTTAAGLMGPIFSVNEVGSRKVLGDYFKVMLSHKSPIALDVKHEYDASSRQLKVNVSGDVLAKMENIENLTVGIYLLEGNLKGSQAGVAGKYYHNHVVRDGMTSVLGNSISVNDNKFTYNTSIKLQDKFKPENMDIVVWVGNKAAKFADPNDYKVYQAFKTKLLK